MSDVAAVISVSQLMLIAWGLVYHSATMIAGLRFVRRERRLISAPPSAGGASKKRWLRRAPRIQPEPASQPDIVCHLIPCLNEAEVIGTTVARLIADPEAYVVVIDDGSDDETAVASRKAARAAGHSGRLSVLRREMPDARQGKGPALNAGFKMIDDYVRRNGIDPERVVVCVMDADGQLSEGALRAVLPLFRDPKVGGAQLAVGIRNRGTWLTHLQHLEFWVLSAIPQYGRAFTGTVSLGGNGQFTRLKALRQLDGLPWDAALTEDLDLSLRLAISGWQLTTTSEAHVTQQAIDSIPRLINQRTRWYQGHMQAVRYAGQIWRSQRLSHMAALELVLYLLLPWTLVLPWSIVFTAGVYKMLIANVLSGAHGGSGTARLTAFSLWYFLSLLPYFAAAQLYRWRQPGISLWRTLVLVHLLLAANYITFIACWRALFRMITGSTSWVKTMREAEEPSAHPSPALPQATPVRFQSERVTPSDRTPTREYV